MDIQTLAEIIKDQADNQFPDRTDSSMFLKLFSELGELIDDGSEEEYADVMIMLLDFGARKHFNITTAVIRKLQINKSRTWSVNELGVMSHVK